MQKMRQLIESRVEFAQEINKASRKQILKNLTELYKKGDFLLAIGQQGQLGQLDYSQTVLSQENFKIKIVKELNNRDVSGHYLGSENAIYLRAEDLQMGLINANLLQHEFWHAYKNYIGHFHYRNKLTGFSEKSKNMLSSFIDEPSKRRIELEQDIKDGKKKINACANKKRECTNQQKEAIKSHQPMPKILYLTDPEPVTENKWKQIQQYLEKPGNYLEQINPETNQKMYIVKMFNQGGKITDILYFPRPPSQKALLMIERLNKFENHLRREKTNQEQFELASKNLRCDLKTINENYILLELDACVREFGSKVVREFFPKLYQYHLDVHKKIQPMLEKNSKFFEENQQTFKSDVIYTSQGLIGSVTNFFDGMYEKLCKKVRDFSHKIVTDCPNVFPPENVSVTNNPYSLFSNKTTEYHEPVPLLPNSMTSPVISNSTFLLPK